MKMELKIKTLQNDIDAIVKAIDVVNSQAFGQERLYKLDLLYCELHEKQTQRDNVMLRIYNLEF